MNGPVLVFLFALVSFLGALCSDLLCRTVLFRQTVGELFGRGRLVALVSGHGLYEKDLRNEELSTASDWVIEENLRRMTRKQKVERTRVDRELSLLHAQFGDENAFMRGIRSSDLSIEMLREKITDRLRAIQWLEQQISPEIFVSEKESRDFFESHHGFFSEPVRFRASHLFLAAPYEASSEIVDSQREAIEALAGRLDQGETLAELCMEASEDAATKNRGGDLGFFSSRRMPPEFLAEIEKLAVGQRSKPFRSHLGFHIVEVTEIKPGEVLSFDEVKPEISLALANQKRRLIAQRLADKLGGGAGPLVTR